MPITTRYPEIMILIADGNYQVTNQAMQLLNSLDHNMGIATTTPGKNILSMARSLKPQVIILDLEMSMGANVDLIKELKTWSPKVVIIGWTSLDTETYKKIARFQSLDHILAKQEMISQLVPAIQNSLINLC